MLDTRGLGGYNGDSGRGFIVNPSVLNSAGKLPAGQTLTLNLSQLVYYGWAVIGNVTVQAPEGNGFVTVFPYGVTRPNTSSLNFFSGWPLSNSVFCALGADLSNVELTDVINIYTPVTTHLLFDVNGFVVGSSAQINPAVTPFSANAASTKSSKAAASRMDKVREFLAKH
jgi:hypothetical protein